MSALMHSIGVSLIINDISIEFIKTQIYIGKGGYYIMDIESHLNQIFEKNAIETHEKEKSTIYDYTYNKGILFDELVSKGKCIVLNRRYDRSVDCDILTIEDIETKNRYTDTMFNIKLK